MRSSITTALVLLFLQSPDVQAKEICSRTGPVCETPLGSYRIALPDVPMPEKGYPALLFFHGAGGSGARTLGNRSLVDAFTKAGYAVIGPDGLQRPNSRFGPGWSFHPERPKQRDEASFTAEIIENATVRHGINPKRVLLSGFSIGGSLTWYLACQKPDLAAAYAPVAGAFWRPHPERESCIGPVKMLHTHGWRDKVVPLEGRPLGGGRIYQGDVFHSLMLMRVENSCDGMRADAFTVTGDFWRRIWNTCAEDTALEFALHPGGHAVPAGWPEMAIEWFEGLNDG